MATRHGMRRHFKIMHKRMRFYLPKCILEAEASTCQVCGRKFLTTFAIQRHIRRVHPDTLKDPPPFRNLDSNNYSSCLFCFKNFSGKQSLDRHLRIVHQREHFCGRTALMLFISSTWCCPFQMLKLGFAPYAEGHFRINLPWNATMRMFTQVPIYAPTL